MSIRMIHANVPYWINSRSGKLDATDLSGFHDCQRCHNFYLEKYDWITKVAVEFGVFESATVMIRMKVTTKQGRTWETLYDPYNTVKTTISKEFDFKGGMLTMIYGERFELFPPKIFKIGFIYTDAPTDKEIAEAAGNTLLKYGDVDYQMVQSERSEKVGSFDGHLLVMAAEPGQSLRQLHIDLPKAITAQFGTLDDKTICPED
jgi:hypothetical protein